MDESEIILGEKYRDTITGFEGTAISRHEYLFGCTRVGLQAEVKDGDIKEYAFDAPSLVSVKTEEEITSRKTGGPRSTPAPRRT